MFIRMSSLLRPIEVQSLDIIFIYCS